MEVKVTNISKGKVANIPHTAPLISIVERHSYPPPIPNVQNRPHLHVEFSPGDYLDDDQKELAITPVIAQKIRDFVQANTEHGHIYIHCTEGRIRSFTVCNALGRYMDGVTHDTANACIKQGTLDRYTHFVMASTLRQ